MVPLAYEINPGDNTTPAVKTVARIGYDDKFFYVSFECEDPDISKLRAPFVDRDGINDDQDYVGILLDVENQNHSAIDFWIGPTGIQADSVFFEGTFTEDFGPDYFWQSAGWIGPSSWNAEVAIPLSSLRYPKKDPQDWALIALPHVSARSQLSVLQRARSARLELLSLQLGDGRGHHRPPAGRALGARALRRDDEHEVLRGGRPPRRQHHDAGPGRPRREVVAGCPHHRGCDDQSRLLPDRGRYGADLGQRAVRPLLSGEAAVLPRARRPAADADPGGLYADDHAAALGRADHGKDRAARTSPRWSPATRAEERSSSPGRSSPRPRLKTTSRRSRSRASARISETRSPACSRPAA